MTNMLLGRQSPARRVDGTQNSSSEFGPSTQPSSILVLSVKEGEVSRLILIKSRC